MKIPSILVAKEEGRKLIQAVQRGGQRDPVVVELGWDVRRGFRFLPGTFSQGVDLSVSQLALACPMTKDGVDEICGSQPGLLRFVQAVHVLYAR